MYSGDQGSTRKIAAQKVEATQLHALKQQAALCHTTALPSTVRVELHRYMQKLTQLISHSNAGLLHFVCICLDAVSFKLTPLKSAV